MGIGAQGGKELANVLLTGTFTATGQSASIPIMGYANFSVWGTPLGANGLSGSFSGTVRLEKSFDGGTTWLPVSLDTSGDVASYNAAGSIPLFETEPGVLYRINCTAYSSGTINYRLSQAQPNIMPIFKV